MIIAETTIATSIIADAEMSLSDLTRKTAITLVLAAAKPLGQATLHSVPLRNGAARAVVRTQEPEGVTVSLSVTTMATMPTEPAKISMLAAADIRVMAETPQCAKQVIDALLTCMPNRVVKPVVIINSPDLPSPVWTIESEIRSDSGAWRSAHE